MTLDNIKYSNGFQNQSASFTDKKVGGWGKRGDCLKLLWKNTEPGRSSYYMLQTKDAATEIDMHAERVAVFSKNSMPFSHHKNNVNSETEVLFVFFSVDNNVLFHCRLEHHGASQGSEVAT